MQTQAQIQYPNVEKAPRQTIYRPNDESVGQLFPIWLVDVGFQIEELRRGRQSTESNKIQLPHPLHIM